MIPASRERPMTPEFRAARRGRKAGFDCGPGDPTVLDVPFEGNPVGDPLQAEQRHHPVEERRRVMGRDRGLNSGAAQVGGDPLDVIGPREGEHRTRDRERMSPS